MDWTQIVTTILSLLIPTGGIVAIFTAREKKTEMALNNMNKINEQWAAFSSKEEERRKELKEDIDSKDGKIDELYREISQLRNELDNERTMRAKAEMAKCLRIKCVERHPPFGESYNLERNGEQQVKQVIL